MTRTLIGAVGVVTAAPMRPAGYSDHASGGLQGDERHDRQDHVFSLPYFG